MPLVKKIKFNELIKFSKDNSLLSIVERVKPNTSEIFFRQLMLLENLGIKENINAKSCFENIKDILDQYVSKNIRNNNFYNFWIKDMANIIQTFSYIIGELNISLSLETSRSCRRYHIDNVPIRLLVTYYGKGTEWLPSDACDYSAYYEGKKNEEIIKNTNQKKFLNSWDIAVFKGQKFKGIKKGILHRTPDAALNKKSLLMRLDYPSEIY